tara:strand:- start:25292 stop:26203 length:912 start_codon:yes stop_codon:yes gene_type:complete
MKKVLVTGGAGFIGSNLVDSLKDDYNYEVCVVDDLSAESNEQFHIREDVSNHQTSITNYEDFLKICEKETPECIFHLAAEARIQPSIHDPRKTCETNFLGTCNVLQAAKETGVKRVIYSSTSSAYGSSNTAPYKETDPKDCLNPYAVSKTGGEELCKAYFDLYGLETITFRYFNVYGPRQPLKGEYAPVIGLFLRQKKAGEPLTIIGDGTQSRDFTHVNDVVKANFLASLTDNHWAFGEIFNIGTGKNYSILELAKMVGGETINLPERLGESKISIADISKARKLLNWEPIESLEEYISNIDF